MSSQYLALRLRKIYATYRVHSTAHVSVIDAIKRETEQRKFAQPLDNGTVAIRRRV